jgi:hypothetical protein
MDETKQNGGALAEGVAIRNENRELALHEAFVTWLAEPLDEFYTGQLAKAFL